MQAVLFILLASLAFTFGAPSRLETGSNCVKSCKKQNDGDYQNCNTCRAYITCSGGYKYNRRCPRGLVWDDEQKICNYKSKTCRSPNSGEKESGEIEVGECIKSCKGLSDGYYQSCKGCRVYATCSKGHLHDGRPCPDKLVWDDKKKRCAYISSTCRADTDESNESNSESKSDESFEVTEVPRNCIDSCKGLKNGNYQSCIGCHVYATCSNGVLYDNRPCPAGLVWDDKRKRCLRRSSTCTDEQVVQDNNAENDEVTEAPTACVESCQGLEDGDYQSCNGCHVYATCANGVLYDNRACPAGLVWDDRNKRCEEESSTCTDDRVKDANIERELENVAQAVNRIKEKEVSEVPPICVESCEGLEDGDYQSCKGCNVYATCSNGLLYDNRDCPAGLVWDDSFKRCEHESRTCTDDNGKEDSEETVTESTVVECITSCAGLKDGDYQSCRGCDVYASCAGGVLYDNRKCPAGLVWDDDVKRCVYTSSTCEYAP